MFSTGQVISVHTPFEWNKPLRYLSVLIRFFTKSFWNHSAIIYVASGIPFVAESDINGVVMYPLKNMSPNKTIRIYSLNLPVDSGRIVSRVGISKYDFRALFIHHLVNIYFGIWIGPKSPGAAYERFTCSEFVAWCLNFPSAYRTRPDELDKHCRMHGKVIYSGKVKDICI
jgi:hypothetical protein